MPTKKVRDANPNKLHNELVAAGIIPIRVTHDRQEGEITANNTWIEFPEGTDMKQVQQLINAHDPTPLPPQPTDKERLEALEQAMLEMILGGAE